VPEKVADYFETFGGRTVVITGGASGIGLATARMVVDRGGSAVLIGRSLDTLKAAREELGPAASIVPLDVTDEDAVRAAFADIECVNHLVTGAAGTLRCRRAWRSHGATRDAALMPQARNLHDSKVIPLARDMLA
jgi:NAD(P)-dependent dehydrogenase (short-subunit alcohol dehydrogenase family)